MMSLDSLGRASELQARRKEVLSRIEELELYGWHEVTTRVDGYHRQYKDAELLGVLKVGAIKFFKERLQSLEVELNTLGVSTKAEPEEYQ